VAGLCWRRAYQGHPTQVGKLRQWITALLPACPGRDDLIAVASELAANAVRHTASGHGGWFEVEISWRPSRARIAVTDQGAPAGPQFTSDPTAESGRGLQIVQALSACTGVEGGTTGRVVWAEIPWTGTGPQEADRPRSPEGGAESAVLS
jgi:hypothetical protein